MISRPLIGDLPASGLQRSGDEVEQRGLAGAVRPDQTQYLTLVHVEVDFGYRGQTAEVPSHPFTFKQVHVDLL